jgi:signal peptidase I
MHLPIKFFLLLLFVLLLGAISRMVTTFLGLGVFLVVLIVLTGFVTIWRTYNPKASLNRSAISMVAKLFFTLTFLLVIGVTLANRRTFLGVDVMRMAVPTMQPSLQPGERFIVNIWAYQKRLPQRGDVVVHAFSGQRGLYVNLIVAIGGDRIELAKGIVQINGKPLSETYVVASNKVHPKSITMQMMVVPEGYYFVLGDNRDASFGDSRFSGCITNKQVVAKVTDIILSPHFCRVGCRVQ